MLDGNLAERGDDILHHRVGLAAFLAAEVVKRLHVGHDVVDNGNDNDNGDGVAPDDNNSDDVSATSSIQQAVGGSGDGVGVWATSEPTEDGKQRGQDIHTEDGKNELERWVSLESTSDEDEPVLGKRHLKEQDALDVAVVLDNTTVLEPESSAQNPGTNGQQAAENNRDDPDLGQLPFDGAALEVSIVVSYGDGSQISEQSEEHDQVDTDSLVNGNHRGNQVQLKVQAKSDTVLDVGLHALENLARDLDGGNDSRQTRSKEDDIGGSLGGFSGTLDSNTTVGLLQ